MPYAFGYSVKEPEYNKDFGHKESSDGKRVTGEYRVLLPDGRTQIVSYYVEGDSGFVADVRYEGQAGSYAGAPPPSLPLPRPLPPRPLPPPPERRPYSPRPEKGPYPPPPERRPYPPRERPPYSARYRPPYRGPPRSSYPEKTTNLPDEPTTPVPPRTTLEDYSTPYPTKEPEYTTPDPDDDAKHSTPPSTEYGSKYTERPAPANYEIPASLYVDNEPVYKGFYSYYNKPEPHYIRVKEPKYLPRPRPHPRPERPRYPVRPIYTVVKPKYQGPPREVERPQVNSVTDVSEIVTENPAEEAISESPIEEIREEIEAERDVQESDAREPEAPEREEPKPAEVNESEEKGQPHDGYSKRPQDDFQRREPHDGYSSKPYTPLPGLRPRQHERERYSPRPYPRPKGPYPPEPYVNGPPTLYKPDDYANKVPHDGYIPKQYRPYIAQDYNPRKPVVNDGYAPKPYPRDYDPRDQRPGPTRPYPPERPNYRDEYKKVVYEPSYKPTQPPSSINGKLYYPEVHNNHGIHKYREPDRRSVTHPHNHSPNTPDCHLIHGDYGARISNRRVDMLRAKLEGQ